MTRPGVTGPEEKTMRSVSRTGRLTKAAFAAGCLVEPKEACGDQALVRLR